MKEAEEARRQAEAEAQRKAEEAKHESESAAPRKAVEETKYRAEQEEQKKEGEDSMEMSNFILPNVDEKLARLIEKLEKWYPEHKAYAMDNIDKKLREDVAAYAKAHGKSVEQLLASVGFEIISGQAVYELRHPKLTRPGQEPEVIKGKIDNILSGLLEYYPDKKISRSIQNDHKAIAGRISGAYQWLGYASVEDFLVAYGFDYSVAQSGRPTGDYDAIINALKAKYPDGPKFSKLGDLVVDNPDLAGKIKTINNKANELFGMSLAKYFQSIGILTPMSASQIAENERKARVDLLVESLMERYPNGSEFTSIEAIRKDNEDLEGWDDITERILQNKGLIRRQKFINTCRVNLVAEGREIVCELKRKFRNLRNVGVYALILDNDGNQTYGTVISDAEEVEVMDLPCDISEVWTIIDVATGEEICRKIFESAVENVGAKINEFTHALTLSADGKKVIRYEEGKNIIKDILVIPDGVEEIGDEVLRNAHFKELHVNAELKIIGAKTLLDDVGRIKETISKILISSENDTFVKDETGVYEVRSEGKKLIMCLNKMAGAEIVLDEDVTSVAPGAFSRSQYIKSIILHSNVEDVGGDPENFGAINIIIDESSKYLFNDEDSIYKILSDGTYKLISCRYRGKGRALILNGTSVIGDFAFKGCTGFKSIQLPSSVKYIGTGAFANCSIQELDIPSTVKRIGDKAFSFNGRLSRVNLPVELEDVEVKAFYGCNMLNEITENGKKGIYSIPNWGEKILTYHGPVKEKTDDVSVLAGEVHADKSVNKVNATVQKVYDIMAPIMKEVVIRRTHENDSIYLDEENQAVVIRTCLDQKAESRSQAYIRVAVADKLKVGDPLELRLDRSRSWVFWEFKYKGRSVADDMEFIAEKLKHLLTKLDVSATVAEVIPKSQRGKGCKYALVSAEITIKEKDDIS